MNARPIDSRGRALRDLRVSVTDRCNFRCGYCMPKDVFGKDHRFLAPRELLTYAEIARIVRVFADCGVQKVRLTGGEPLLRHDLESLVEQLARIDGIRDIALTTNASLLTKSRAHTLRAAGVRRLNISLDALDPAVYRRINQIPTPLDDVLAGIDNARAAEFDALKVNMVVQKNINDGEILPMAERFRESGIVLRFIEFMDAGNHNQWQLRHVFTAREIIARIHEKYPLEAVDASYPGEPAMRWRYRDGGGEIGVIASVSRPFCGQCNRARLSAAGELFTCLFATRGVDLRAALRGDDAALRARIEGVWQRRDDRYSQLRLSGEPRAQKVEMSYIGG